MLFRQLFEPQSSTYTYLLADERTRRAVLIDPVVEDLEKYTALLAELDLTLVYTLETHVHADHVTAADALRQRLGSQTVVHRSSGAACADRLVVDGDRIEVDEVVLEVRETPGHTDSCVSYVASDRVFTGDALLIGGCGRTDFQQGSADRLYDSVHSVLFALPPETLVYPAHDYKGQTETTIGREQQTNPRLGGGKTRAEFVEIMRNLNLAQPKQIDRAVPANLSCGKES
jgi:glyoxylase-like metal-dependent hydrolase (beta-lactamase superfamily II)